MTIDTTTPAVVLTLSRNATQHGGLGAIRSLGRLGVPVYGVHAQALAPAARSRYLKGSWRPANDDVEPLQKGLVTLAERIGQRSVLIPTDDAAAIFLAEHGAPLRRWFQFSNPPSDLPRRLAGRYTLHQLCRELGVPSVLAELPGSLAEAEAFADLVGFPLIAKLATPWLASNGAARPSTSILHTRDNLGCVFQTFQDNAAPENALMLQEYIPRCPSQDYFFHGYCDASSRCVPGFVGITERSYPAHAGLTSLGRWVDNSALHEQATDLVARLGYQGILDLEYRWDPRDCQYKLMNFNPRLGAQFRLFSDDAGVDVVVAAHLDLTGRPISAGPPLTGRRFLVENYDPVAALGYRRSGELSLLSWVMSLRLVDEVAWFARDDLAPFGLMCLRSGARALTRSITRGLPRLTRSRPANGSPANGSPAPSRPQQPLPQQPLPQQPRSQQPRSQQPQPEPLREAVPLPV
ncbi:MAG: carboxylate--amine ligase [Pseudonocardiales bacterium]